MPADDLDMPSEPARPRIWSLADVVDEVCNVLGPDITRSTVVTTVRRCKRELELVHAPARPEHVQRMAIERLRRARRQTVRRETTCEPPSRPTSSPALRP